HPPAGGYGDLAIGTDGCTDNARRMGEGSAKWDTGPSTPEPGGLAVPTSQKSMPVGVKGHRIDVSSGPPLQPFWNGSRAADEVPGPNRPIERSRHDRLTVCSEGDSRNVHRVGQRWAEGLSHRDIPQSRDAGLRAGENPPAVGTERHAMKW